MVVLRRLPVTWIWATSCPQIWVHTSKQLATSYKEQGQRGTGHFPKHFPASLHCTNLRSTNMSSLVSRIHVMQMVDGIRKEDHCRQLITSDTFKQILWNADDTLISNIEVELRQMKLNAPQSGESLDNEPLELAQLPSQMIAHIASFLPQKSYFRYALVSRSVYIALDGDHCTISHITLSHTNLFCRLVGRPHCRTLCLHSDLPVSMLEPIISMRSLEILHVTLNLGNIRQSILWFGLLALKLSSNDNLKYLHISTRKPPFTSHVHVSRNLVEFLWGSILWFNHHIEALVFNVEGDHFPPTNHSGSIIHSTSNLLPKLRCIRIPMFDISDDDPALSGSSITMDARVVSSSCNHLRFLRMTHFSSSTVRALAGRSFSELREFQASRLSLDESNFYSVFARIIHTAPQLDRVTLGMHNDQWGLRQNCEVINDLLFTAVKSRSLSHLSLCVWSDNDMSAELSQLLCLANGLRANIISSDRLPIHIDFYHWHTIQSVEHLDGMWNAIHTLIEVLREKRQHWVFRSDLLEMVDFEDDIGYISPNIAQIRDRLQLSNATEVLMHIESRGVYSDMLTITCGDIRVPPISEVNVLDRCVTQYGATFAYSHSF